MPLDEDTIRLIEQLMEVAQDASTLPAHCQGALLASGIRHVQATWKAYIAAHERRCASCGEPSGLQDTCPGCAVEAFLAGRDLKTDARMTHSEDQPGEHLGEDSGQL